MGRVAAARVLLLIPRKIAVAADDAQTLDQTSSLVRFLVSSLTGLDEEVTVQTHAGQRALHLDVLMPEDMRGRIIGKGGRTVRALRQLAAFAARQSDKPVLVNIVE